MFGPDEREWLKGQQALFRAAAPPAPPATEILRVSETRPVEPPLPQLAPQRDDSDADTSFELNAEQQAAVDHADGPLVIVAGPGSESEAAAPLKADVEDAPAE